MTSNIAPLDDLAEQYQSSVPDDLREAQSFDWYLSELQNHPEIARNAHQRLADMFDYYGTEYDEDTGIVRYQLASEDPLHDGENVFYGEDVHQTIHEFVNKLKSGSRGLGPERRIKLLLGPVGSGNPISTGRCDDTSRIIPARMRDACTPSAGSTSVASSTTRTLPTTWFTRR